MKAITSIKSNVRQVRKFGLTLLETIVVLVISAIVVGGVMLFATTATNAQKTNDAMSELAGLQTVVRSLTAGQPDYSSITTAILAQSGQLPAKWVSGTALSSPFTAPVTVVSANSNENYTITMNQIPNAACSTMVTTDFGTGLVSLTAGGTTVNARAMTPVEAQTACAGANANTIAWTFF